MRSESTYLELREEGSPDQTLLIQAAVILHFFYVCLWALIKFGVLKHEDSL